jgi:hypothetical protein
MSKNKSLFLAKGLVLAALAVTVSAARAEITSTADNSLVQSAKDAVHYGTPATNIRVQAVDGVVYLYGHTTTYLSRVEVENAVRAAVPGHQVISSIEDGSYQ